MLSLDDFILIAPALVAGAMVAILHTALGVEVLKRGIIFLDLAIAQIAGLGLIASEIFFGKEGHSYSGFIALGFALVGGMIFKYLETHFRDRLEALIGSCYILASALAILLLSTDPHGGEALGELLSGQILFTTWSQVLIHAPIYAAVLLLWFWKPQWARKSGFFLLFTLAVTSSVQLVGVMVVFSSLVMPAIACRDLKNPLRLAWAISLISVFFGISLSMLLDWPTGPSLVCAYAISGWLVLIFTIKNH